jgi:Carboxypeptidase regulatory-like domain/TonB-dependent Receptor Plug Domain
MRFKVIVLAVVAMFAASSLATAQQQTGEVFGKVTDGSGAVLPGVTVTLAAPNLLQPLTAVTSETGTYQFPRLEIGVYSVKFELAGFKTVVNEGIRVTVGFSAQVNAQLGISTVQETITVTGQSPIVDTKETGTKQTFTNELLQSIPSARDPWVILQQTAGIAMDRENIGGNMSGQQSNYVSRGGNPTNNKWSLDGVDITDLSATGSSPTYYDFDAFEEMTVNTGGVDVTQQTGGVGINLVTKSGSDRFRGSSRFFRTNDKFESNNLTDAIRKQGASSGNPIQDIQDYGIEAGGPIKKGRAWIWGSFGKNVIDVGVLGFFLPSAPCQAIKADQAANPLAHTVDDVNGCLNTDETLLRATNLKAEVQLFKGNKLSAYNLFSKKVRNARNASDLTPIESTVIQDAVSSTYGTYGWRTGPTPTYKFGDQWVVSDRLLLDVQYAHVGNNFILDYHDPSYPTQTPVAGIFGLQPTFITSTSLNGRSTPDNSQSVNIRPVNSITLNANYFLPGGPGGDHSFRIGGYWRDNDGYGSTHTPGNAVARFPTSAELASPNDCATQAIGCQMQLTRDAQTEYRLTNVSGYVQDTITHGRATLQLGVRYDYNHDQALASSVAANPLRPDILPAINFAGTDPGVKYNNISPRLGLTYDLSGNGKTIVRGNYAQYWGQVGVGTVAGQVNPVSRVSIRYPWVDTNHDTFVQPGEIIIPGGNIANYLALTGNWDPAAPGSPTTANKVDPNLKNDRTDEIIIGVDREIGAGFAVGANYVWRRYSNFLFTDTIGLEPADYVKTTFTPAAGTCPGDDGNRISAATCPTVTMYVPAFQTPSPSILTNFTSDQYNRTFNGFELSARKRMSHHWLMNTSFSYNSTIVHNGYAGAFANNATFQEDPTNVANRDGFQYDYQSAGSGLGNVFVNTKWLYKLSGLYNLPFDVNVSGFFNARQGYPEEFALNNTSRLNGAGTVLILLNPVGDTRLPNYGNLDFHVDRPIKVGTVRFVPTLDVFNVTNSNTIQGVRTNQNATNANQVQAITAPRVLRFGIRFNW